LVERGLVSRDAFLTCHSITGYSGGGKKMIAEYEDPARPDTFEAPRQYGLTQQHKHLKEMKAITDLAVSPIFCPIVAGFYSGMMVTVPLFREQLRSGASMEDVRKVYRELYCGKIVRYGESVSENGLMSANALKNRDSMQITVEGNEERMLLIARYDNLGKGASGAAVECMNIVMGKDPATGLDL
ncbi:MAG: N-acetyl-gamma-glutamyl-phosphate reductase, partial [Lentisphaeria bacterium]|nr:N-acetyl-gamma-glutamyl-phosphate reductase [Lentisphaeria bacterium]